MSSHVRSFHLAPKSPTVVVQEYEFDYAIRKSLPHVCFHGGDHQNSREETCLTCLLALSNQEVQMRSVRCRSVADSSVTCTSPSSILSVSLLVIVTTRKELLRVRDASRIIENVFLLHPTEEDRENEGRSRAVPRPKEHHHHGWTVLNRVVADKRHCRLN